MLIIQKISLAYNQDQDRISVTAETLDGQPLFLWLTQRLALRLCIALANWLDEDVSVRTSPQDAPTVHTWEQAAASSTLTPSAPANVGAAPFEALITAADIGRLKGECMIALRWSETAGCQVFMSRTELRQWLDILHRQFKSAEWPTQQMPLWLRESGIPGTGMSSAMH